MHFSGLAIYIRDWHEALICSRTCLPGGDIFLNWYVLPELKHQSSEATCMQTDCLESTSRTWSFDCWLQDLIHLFILEIILIIQYRAACSNSWHWIPPVLWAASWKDLQDKEPPLLKEVLPSQEPGHRVTAEYKVCPALYLCISLQEFLKGLDHLKLFYTCGFCLILTKNTVLKGVTP